MSQNSDNGNRGNEPYIKDFSFYKTRFATKHKSIKERLRDFALIVERFEDQSSKAYGDMESGSVCGNIQDVIAKVNSTSESIQMEIDEVRNSISYLLT